MDADRVLEDLLRKHDQEMADRRERRRQAEWQEPSGAGLHRVIVLPQTACDPVEAQRLVARETGVSLLISDYFTTGRNAPLPEEARTGMPAWRLLYLLTETGFWNYEWKARGECLVMHDARWYALVPTELPETLIVAAQRGWRSRAA